MENPGFTTPIITLQILKTSKFTIRKGISLLLTLFILGEMAERTNAPVLNARQFRAKKTGGQRPRGFESLSHRIPFIYHLYLE